MSGNERIKGIQVHRPVIYGSQARLLTEEEKATAPPGHTHKWTIFLASAATPPPAPRSSNEPPPVDMDYLPGGADDLQYLVKRVVFRLHETYPNPNRMCEKPPYKVSETGWGEFTVQIKVTFVPEAAEKALSLQHPIKLHHWGEPIEALPPAPTAPASEATPTSTPAADKMDTESTVVKAEEATPTIVEASVPGTAEVSGTTTEAPTAPVTEAATPADGAAPAGANDNGLTLGVAPAVSSIAAMYPVHAWQYDEIVFSDPPANFLSLLEDHPPTPLPARNRRPKNQREEHELKTGKKKARQSVSARPSVSRAGTEAIETPRGGTPAAGTAAGTPAAGTPMQLGAPGELGSADVPLEFTTEMEKGEFNRLTDIRIRIVEQMDRWREKLISQEKELARLKQEMKG